VRLPISAESHKPPARPKVSESTPRARRILLSMTTATRPSPLAMMLKLTGNETHTAYDGVAALEMAARLRPDLVLLDVGRRS